MATFTANKTLLNTYNKTHKIVKFISKQIFADDYRFNHIFLPKVPTVCLKTKTDLFLKGRIKRKVRFFLNISKYSYL